MALGVAAAETGRREEVEVTVGEAARNKDWAQWSGRGGRWGGRCLSELILRVG